MKEVTELVFILDRSGSMFDLVKSTINGFNKMLAKQKKLKGKAYVTTILFNDRIKVLYEDKSIKKVKKMKPEDFRVSGMTALLDTVGLAINKTIVKEKKQKSDHVIFVIMSDGFENASKEYSYSQIKKLIARQQEKYNWEFIFLGARINACHEASKIGIDINHSITFYEDDAGVEVSFEAMNDYLSNSRKNTFDPSWSNKVREDYQRKR